MSKQREIYVSIIISVYNTEKFLRKCLNSLVTQTLKEIEIIAVNNGSTDNSGEILNEYEKNYPEIVKIITLKKNTGDPAEPWNTGISIARGKYISIVDSDDWCNTSMFELLYNSGEKYKSDMVLCDHFEVYGKNNSIRSKINQNAGEFSLKELMLYPHMAPWGKIVRRSVYTKNNLKYKSQIHCDTGLNLIMYGLLEKVSYVDEPLYYYNRINPNSETNTKKRMRQATIVDTLDHILDHYNTEWEDEVVFDIIRFLYWFCFTEYVFHQDIFIPFIKKHEKEIRRNKYLRANHEGLHIVLDYLDKEMVPKRFVYSSFGKETFSDLEKSCVESWEKYTNGYEFVLLNEKNCDIGRNSHIKKLYDSGQFELVGAYYVLKELYERGGIALSTCMYMNGPIGELRMHKITVGYRALDKIGDEVIAAMPRNPLIRHMCEHILALDEFEKNETISRNDAETDIWNFEDEKQKVSVISKYFQDYLVDLGYVLSNQNMILKNDIQLLACDRLYHEINHNNLFAKMYPQTYNLCEKPFIALHEDAIKSYTNYINTLEAERQMYSGELARIMNSRSWRYLEPVRKFMRMIRSIKSRFFS